MAAGADRTLKDFFPPAIYSERKVTNTYVPLYTNGDGNTDYAIFGKENKVRIRRVDAIYDAAITGANTNTFHVDIINKGTAGSGTTELSTKEYVAGTNAAAFDRVELYAPTTPLVLAADSVLAIRWEEVGSGQDGPNALLVVEYADVEEPPKK